MQFEEDSKRIRTSESTTSSDSGVMIEDTISIKNNDLTKNINISFKNNNNNNNNNDNSYNPSDDDLESCKLNNICNNIIEENISNNKNSNSNSNNSNNNNSDSGKVSPCSIHSNKISILSIDDDADSSIIDSDSDFDENITNGDFIIQKLGQHSSQNDSNDDVIIINQNLDNNNICSIPTTSSTSSGYSGSIVTPSKPQIGSIAVQNSTDITFGNKTFYQGPVTIKQFLLDNKNKWKPNTGNDNPSFENNDESNLTSNDEKDIVVQNLPPNHQKKIIAMVGVIILVAAVLGSITYTAIMFAHPKIYKTGDGDDLRGNIPIASTIGRDLIADGREHRHVKRDEWLAQPPNGVLAPLELPAHRVIIIHTATENCTTQAECTFRVRYMQTFHIESRGWDDIAYNFLVGGDGCVYEARGWDQQGAHTKNYNVDSIGIAFIGTFIKMVPPERQINAAKELMAEGVKLGKLVPDYKIFGHRQLIPSESPGEALYEEIQTWPHWSATLDRRR